MVGPLVSIERFILEPSANVRSAWSDYGLPSLIAHRRSSGESSPPLDGDPTCPFVRYLRMLAALRIERVAHTGRGRLAQVRRLRGRR
jgi:hypothetical protein